MNPLDGPSSTDDDAHHTDPDAVGSDGSYSDDYGSESETFDPRRALATTASMQSYVSETAERDSDDDDSENSSQPSRVKVRLVSPLASLLLPRSSRVALGAAATILFILAAAATAGALAAVDSFYADLEDVSNVAPKIVAIERADAAVQTAAAVYTLAALSGGDAGLVAHFSALQGNVTDAVTELRVALGHGDHTASNAAVRQGVWWAKARGHSIAPAPKTSADLSECARVALERAQRAFVGSNAVTAQFGLDAELWKAPAVDALVVAMSAAAELHSLTPTVTDAELAVASANSGNVGVTTRADIDAASDAANSAIGLAAGALFGFRGAEHSPAATLALVYATVPGTLAATVAAKHGLTTPLIDLRVAMAVATWAARAHANVSALVTRMRPIAANPSTAADVRALAAALVAATDSLATVIGAVAPHGDPVRYRVPPSTELLLWCTAAVSRHGATYPFNSTAVAGLAEQGLADAAASPLPWLAAEYQRSPASVREWLRRQAQPVALNSAFTGMERTACSGSLSDVAAESSRARDFLVTAATRYAESRLGEAEDAGRDGLGRPHRDGMIASVVCIIAAVALVAVYGHWGVATRLSASTLPFTSFMQGWWLVALLVTGVVAWATGHALAEFDDATTQDMPRNVGLGSGQFARFANAERSQALVASAIASVLEPSMSPALQNVSSGNTAGVRDMLVTPLQSAVQSTPTSVEDELAGSAILRFTLGKSDALWAAPSSLPSGGAATTRRAQAACAASFGAYAAIAGVRMSMGTEAATVAVSTASGGVVATTATSNAADRASAINPAIQQLQRLVLNSDGPLRAECLAAGENTAAFAALIEWASDPVDRAIAAIRALATAHTQRDASGALSAGALGLRGLLPTHMALVSGSGAFEGLLAERSANAEAERLWARGMEQDLAARRRLLRRLIVWGSIAGCVVAQGVLALLWRMLFGPNWTPF